jgi:phosphatidylinositol-3-phosphatase
MKRVYPGFQKSYRLISVTLLVFISSLSVNGQNLLPRPDHIVVAFLENHAFTQIIDSACAPFINSLAIDENSALFNRSYGIEHPSQPNYLDFFSGCNQGVTNNNVPASNPFKTPNLGRQLLDSMLTFITYSEDLPYEGYNGATFEHYVRKHNPVTNWIGADTNQIPGVSNQPFTSFPISDFDSLPTVSFVMPNQSNNMHDGEDPSRILRADTWLYENLNNYIEWTKTHNSLFILTFDEDNYENGNRIVTIFTGMMVNGGVYSDSINHYSVLRTIEDIYGLPYAGNAASALPITSCWKEVNEINEPECAEEVTIYPNPASDFIYIDNSNGSQLELFSLEGKLRFSGFAGNNHFCLDVSNLQKGVYTLIVSSESGLNSAKVVVD